MKKHLPGKRIVCPVCLTEIRQENVPAGTFFNTYCTGCGMDAGENVLQVTTREGLLWNGQEQIDLPLADRIAAGCGHQYAEHLVRELASEV
jgi:hypothetical protein